MGIPWLPPDWTVLGIAQALSTPAIAIAGAMIAWSNLRLQKIKRADNLYKYRKDALIRASKSRHETFDRLISRIGFLLEKLARIVRQVDKSEAVSLTADDARHFVQRAQHEKEMRKKLGSKQLKPQDGLDNSEIDEIVDLIVESYEAESRNVFYEISDEIEELFGLRRDSLFDDVRKVNNAAKLSEIPVEELHRYMWRLQFRPKVHKKLRLR